MSRHTLEVSFNAAADETSPVFVRTDTELELLLARLSERQQPNPPSIVLLERPVVGPHAMPDHVVKIDMNRHAGIGAILFGGPRDTVPVNAPDIAQVAPEGGVWVTKSTSAVPDDAPPLYIDSATLTEFPRDATLPLDTWRAALREFMRTGMRPTVVDWQPSDVY